MALPSLMSIFTSRLVKVEMSDAVPAYIMQVENLRITAVSYFTCPIDVSVRGATRSRAASTAHLRSAITPTAEDPSVYSPPRFV